MHWSSQRMPPRPLRSVCAARRRRTPSTSPSSARRLLENLGSDRRFPTKDRDNVEELPNQENKDRHWFPCCVERVSHAPSSFGTTRLNDKENKDKSLCPVSRLPCSRACFFNPAYPRGPCCCVRSLQETVSQLCCSRRHPGSTVRKGPTCGDPRSYSWFLLASARLWISQGILKHFASLHLGFLEIWTQKIKSCSPI